MKNRVENNQINKHIDRKIEIESKEQSEGDYLDIERVELTTNWSGQIEESKGNGFTMYN